MRELPKKFMILSAEYYTLSKSENEIRTNTLRSCLEIMGVDFEQVSGVYKGTSEVSFLCDVSDIDTQETIQNLAFDVFGQESVLHKEYDGFCELLYKDARVDYLGKVKQITEDEAKELDAYTILADNSIITVG